MARFAMPRNTRLPSFDFPLAAARPLRRSPLVTSYMKSQLRPFLAALCAAVVFTRAGAAEEPTSIKFSDPSQPGTLKISLGRGELHIQGTDAAEVTVISDAKAETEKPRKDGLRVISSAAGFSVREKGNQVTLDMGANEGWRGSGSVKVNVPRTTNVIVQNAWGGDISCAGVAGDVEINCMHGEIRLDDLSGGAVVSTMNGQIRANIRELREGKPLSFTSMNGEVVLRLPATAKANVRLRTQNGSVLTDFDETTLATKTESSPGRSPRVTSSRNGKVLTAEVQDAIREAAQVGATAVRQALEAVKQGLEAAQLDSDDARRDLESAKRDLERARRDADRERARDGSGGAAPHASPGAPVPPKIATGPVPPKAPVPTITGGKLVTGTLNGGGPEISVSTMNGDVVLRKMTSAK
jgi:hypothetical protein